MKETGAETDETNATRAYKDFLRELERYSRCTPEDAAYRHKQLHLAITNFASWTLLPSDGEVDVITYTAAAVCLDGKETDDLWIKVPR